MSGAVTFTQRKQWLPGSGEADMETFGLIRRVSVLQSERVLDMDGCTTQE